MDQDRESGISRFELKYVSKQRCIKQHGSSWIHKLHHALSTGKPTWEALLGRGWTPSARKKSQDANKDSKASPRAFLNFTF
jgi:hypothetical protein